MFLRQSLKRTRQEYQSTRKALMSASDMLKMGKLRSDVEEFRKREAERLDCTMIDAAVKGYQYEVEPETLVGGGMVASSTKYPAQAEEMLNSEPRQRDLGYCQGLFWLYSNKQLLLWTATTPTLESQKLQWKWVQKLSFDEDITCFAAGKVNNIGLGFRPDCQIIVVSIVTRLYLFLFDGHKVVDLNIYFIVSQQIHKILVGKNGNIYSADKEGRVKALINTPFRSKITYKQKDSLGLLARLQKMISFGRPRTTVLQLLLNPSQTELYCLTSQEKTNRWLSLRFYRSGIARSNTVKAYKISENGLQPSYQINDQKIQDRLKIFQRSAGGLAAFYCLQAAKQVQIFRLYLTKDNNLGLVLRSGLMVSLKNNRTAEIFSVSQPSVQGNCNLIYETLKPVVYKDVRILNSLGLDSISNANGFIIFADGIQNSVCNKSYREMSQLAEINNMSIFNRQLDRRWLILHDEGVDILRNFSNAQKILCIIEISESLSMTVADSQMALLFQEMCQNMGIVSFCIALIEIICNLGLKYKMPKQMYYKTLFKVIQITKKREDPIQPPKSQGDTTIYNEPRKVYIAGELLSLYQGLPLKRIISPYSALNVFLNGLSFYQYPGTDALWEACLLYFGALVQPILYKPTNFYKKQPAIITTIDQKLEYYFSFLQSKIRQLKQPPQISIRVRFLQNNTDKSENLDSMDIEEQTRQATRDTLTPNLKQFPKNNTSNLLVKISATVEKIRLLMIVLSNLVYFQSISQIEPTLYILMSNPDSLKLLRQRIFKSFPLDHQIYTMINGVMPQLLTMEHVTLEKWLADPENSEIQFDSFMGALDSQRMERCKQVCLGKKLYWLYYELYQQRLSYLGGRSKSLMLLKNQVDQRNRINSRTDDFDKMEAEELSRQIKENQEQSAKQHQKLYEDIENLIRLNKKEAPQAEDIKKLDAALSSVYSSGSRDILEKCLAIASKTMMIPQIRYLKSHPLLQSSSPT